MKQLRPIEPMLLCKRVPLQDKVGQIIIPGSDDKISTIAVVIKNSNSAKQRGVEEGDIIVTRQSKYLELPVYLTEDDQVPLNDDNSLEIIDPTQIVAIYRSEEKEKDVCKKEDNCCGETEDKSGDKK